MLHIAHATLFTPSRRIEDGAVLVAGTRIAALDVSTRLPCPSGAQAIDATGLLLVPGFIDLQINGAFGDDFTANPATIWRVAEHLPRFGVTAFLPTIITSPPEVITDAQAILLGGPHPDFHGATPLGLHLEGPFLNPAKCGAHNPAHLRLPDETLAAAWSPERGVRLVTLAPELPNALKMIRLLHERGVVVGAGHSLADYEQARAGIQAGITYATHLFNAMPPLAHRAPSLVGALLTDPRVTVGLIPDGIHLHPAIVKLIWQSTGAGRVNIVTDAIAALGMRPGNYQLGDLEVTVDGTSARLSDGRLAGSILSPAQALRNLIAFTGCSLPEALLTLTTVPAQVLGLTDRGQIAPGCMADLTLLTPDLHIVATVINGQMTGRGQHGTWGRVFEHSAPGRAALRLSHRA